MAGLCWISSSGSGALNSGGLLAGFVRATLVVSSPGAHVAPSSACLAEESSPNSTKACARFCDVDATLLLCELWQLPAPAATANMANRSRSMFFGINPPLPCLKRRILGNNKKSFHARVVMTHDTCANKLNVASTPLWCSPSSKFVKENCRHFHWGSSSEREIRSDANILPKRKHVKTFMRSIARWHSQTREQWAGTCQMIQITKPLIQASSKPIEAKEDTTRSTTDHGEPNRKIQRTCVKCPTNERQSKIIQCFHMFLKFREQYRAISLVERTTTTTHVQNSANAREISTQPTSHRRNTDADQRIGRNSASCNFQNHHLTGLEKLFRW